jgi:predicted cation transporter
MFMRNGPICAWYIAEIAPERQYSPDSMSAKAEAAPKTAARHRLEARR